MSLAGRTVPSTWYLVPSRQSESCARFCPNFESGFIARYLVLGTRFYLFPVSGVKCMSKE